MKRELIMLFAAIALAFGMWISASTYLMAQDDPVAAEVETPSVPTIENAIEIPTVPDEPTGDNVVTAVVKNINDWKSGAWLAAVLGLAYILVLLSKLRPIDALLKKHKVKWLRPIFAAVFGGLAAAVTALSIGEPPIAVIVTGVIAGLGSTGFHELLSVVTSKAERKRRES